ncbi:BRO1 domain-containing protein BROX-like isoform X4 [Tamandua tetradactyla]|uniref:BRO1 domain-containing protein BROX-like isoform X4 n=1 Tax=Tamandua tetradactyla TaxID=48850 RepID=UPI00405459E6
MRRDSTPLAPEVKTDQTSGGFRQAPGGRPSRRNLNFAVSGARGPVSRRREADNIYGKLSIGFILKATAPVSFNYNLTAGRAASKVCNATEGEAKEVHQSLKVTAGIFKHLKENHI